MLLVLALGLLALRWAVRDQASPQAAIAGLRSIRDEWWALPAYAGLYLSLTTVFFPGLVFHLASGATWGFPLASVVNVLLMNLSASLQFWLARTLGREQVASLLRRYGLLKLDSGAQQHGVRAMIAIRAIPLPSMLVNASAGVSGMRYRDFVIGTGIGALPYILIYTWFAAAIADGVAGAEQRALFQGGIAAVVILVLAIVPRLWAARVKRAAGLKATAPPDSGS